MSSLRTKPLKTGQTTSSATSKKSRAITSSTKSNHRIVIDRIEPELDHGRHAVKTVLGEPVEIKAVIIADGHETVEAKAFYRHESEKSFKAVVMKSLGNDIWSATFVAEKIGRYLYAVEGTLESTVRSPERVIVVEPKLAGFSSWYEFFPRSFGSAPFKHGTFKESKKMLDYAARLGFNVVYLPPIHPLGQTKKKGKNNTLAAKPDDVGSPWAIGSEAGGHKAVHPALGTMHDFEDFVAHAKSLKLEIALDIAFQCSPDHPYLKEHEEWFKKRADGTIQCAENPPKKYEDIYPFDFFCADREGLWNELKSVFLFWIDKGISVFRVDNPHTKPFEFWEWVIREIKAEHPKVIFLSEAFTRPHIMKYLAKIGFSQSYTYFTWRTSPEELRTYALELIEPTLANYMRPNFWPNTPDILAPPLRNGSREDFKIRYLLAATLSSNYGIYGPSFELIDGVPREPKAEEYLNSEKYELKNWNLKDPASIAPLIGQVNQIRNRHDAFQSMKNLKFHATTNLMLLAYSNFKLQPDGTKSEIILTVVNLDPKAKQSGMLEFRHVTETFEVKDLLSEATYSWKGSSHYIELNPALASAHIFRIELKS